MGFCQGLFFPGCQLENEQAAHVFNNQHDLLTVLKRINYLMRTKQHQNLHFDQYVPLRQFPFFHKAQ